MEYVVDSVAALASASVPVGDSYVRTLGHTTPGDGGGIQYVSTTALLPGGVTSVGPRYWAIIGPRAHVRAFGAKGDYNTDDRAALIAAFAWSSLTGNSIDFSDAICGCVGSIDMPEGVRLWGDAPVKLNTWFYEGTDQQNMRPGYKHKLRGAAIILKGAADLTYETDRTGFPLASFTYGLSYLHQSPMEWSGVALIKDYDVRTVAGAKTTSANDNKADYEVGLVYRGPQGLITRSNFFGLSWWSLVVHSQTNLEIADSDYVRAFQTDFTSVALIAGHQVDTQGLTGFNGTQCGFYNSADHHHAPSGDYVSFQAIYVDGNTGSLGSRGHVFDGNFRTKANVAIRLDHASNVTFRGPSEFPTVPDIPNADAQGEIRGTTNTHNVTIISPAAQSSNPMGAYTLMQEISGSVFLLGGEPFKDITTSRDGRFARMGVNVQHDPFVQFGNLAADPNDGVGGWVLKSDESNGDRLEFRYNNSVKLSVTADSELSADRYYLNSSVFTSAGTGSPEGVVTASPGSEYVQTNGIAGKIRWLKRSGTSNTGWVPDAADGIIVGMSAIQAAMTGTTAQTTLAMVTIPAGLMGPNGRVEVHAQFTHTNGADNKVLRVKFGGTSTAIITATTTGANQIFSTISNRNSVSSQISSSGLGAIAPGYPSSDTSAAVDVTLTGQLTNTADTIYLESYKVVVFYRA